MVDCASPKPPSPLWVPPEPHCTPSRWSLPDGHCGARRRHRIAMVTDFFYPATGGVEHHVQQLARCLQQQGHQVVIITHRYGSQVGVHWLGGDLKVYYLPFEAAWLDRCLVPTAVRLLPKLQDILWRESITIVHGHAVCTMALESVVLASLLGYGVVYTEHSNYGLHEPTDALLNQLCRAVLVHADAVIGVSQATRENVTRRCHLEPSAVHAIPNAVDARQFQPCAANVRPDAGGASVNVVVMSRFVWRKGIDLLVQVVPEVCRRFPQVHFIIGGDGPKRGAIEEMRERHGLHESVEMLGVVPHEQVPAVLTRGHIFLNTSRTEAFCIAILEAVACGLLVVSTAVGGVPEILPHHMLRLAPPQPQPLIQALAELIPSARDGHPRHRYHEEVARMYSWQQVAQRTVGVYDCLPWRDASPRPPALLPRLRRLGGLGLVSGPLAVAIVCLQYFCIVLLGLVRPVERLARLERHAAEDEGRRASKSKNGRSG